MSYDTTREQRLKKEGLTMTTCLLHPKSVGEIKLKSADPLAHPSIDPHYLEDPYDVKALIEVSLAHLSI